MSVERKVSLTILTSEDGLLCAPRCRGIGWTQYYETYCKIFGGDLNSRGLDDNSFFHRLDKCKAVEA